MRVVDRCVNHLPNIQNIFNEERLRAGARHIFTTKPIPSGFAKVPLDATTLQHYVQCIVHIENKF